MNETNLYNSSIDPSTLISPEAANIFSYITMGINLFSLISLIAFGYGLYLINKKLGERHAWLSFIPLIQYYSLVKASGKSLWWILWMILIGIGGVIISYIILGIVGYFIVMNVGIDYFFENIASTISIIFLMIIFIFISSSIGYIYILHKISKRVGRTGLTTLGFLIIPYIVFPYVGIKFKDTNQVNKDDGKGEKEEVLEIENKTIEL